jgi:hypothetical protein
MVLTVVIWLALVANTLSQPGHIQPLPLPQPVQPLPDRDPDDCNVRKVFTWQFPERVARLRGMLARTFTVELSISRGRYEEYRQRPRLAPGQWDEYVREHTPETLVLAGRLLALGRGHLYRGYEQACNTLAFVQHCIAYAADVSPVDGQPIEYPKYPIEALLDEQGDCEDHALLAGALLKRMGYEVALVFLPDHAALGVAGAEGLPGAFIQDPKTGKRYFYGETTGEGWLLGELPQRLQPLLASGQVELLPVL